MTSKILSLSNKLALGELTSLQLTNAYIEAVKSQNPVLNAVACETFDEALKNAEYADMLLKQGKGGPLCGIPFVLKDNICTDGLLTTCCSRILQGFKPYYSATVWQKLKDMGAVLIGKANMDEFAMGSTGETSAFGPSLNPYDSTKVTGGSSGGVACAVSSDMAVYGLGSDTGGSVRQPACFCGVVGFKPSYGKVSRYGLIAYGSSLDQIGPITSSVTDAAIVFDAIKGEDKADSTSVPSANKKTALVGDVSGKRVGVLRELFEGANAEVVSKINSVIAAYQGGGAIIEEVSIPALKLALPVYYIIACAEASSNLGRYDGIRYGFRAENYSGLDDMVVKTRSRGFGREVKKRIMLGTYVLSSGYFDAYYKKACMLRAKLEGELDNVFEKFDFLISPTAPRTAFPLGYSGGNALETYLSDACTVPVNIAGLPAISLPCGRDCGGMPTGVQLIGKKYADEELLDFAYFAEKSSLCDIVPPKGGANV